MPTLRVVRVVKKRISDFGHHFRRHTAPIILHPKYEESAFVFIDFQLDEMRSGFNTVLS
jgi:hypothetical protein